MYGIEESAVMSVQLFIFFDSYSAYRLSAQEFYVLSYIKQYRVYKCEN